MGRWSSFRLPLSEPQEASRGETASDLYLKSYSVLYFKFLFKNVCSSLRLYLELNFWHDATVI